MKLLVVIWVKLNLKNDEKKYGSNKLINVMESPGSISESSFKILEILKQRTITKKQNSNLNVSGF